MKRRKLGARHVLAKTKYVESVNEPYGVFVPRRTNCLYLIVNVDNPLAIFYSPHGSQGVFSEHITPDFPITF